MDINYAPPKEAYVSYVKNDFYNLPSKKIVLTVTTNGKNGLSVIETDNNNSLAEDINDLRGINAFDIVANTSQRDYIPETINDKFRCGSSSLLNAYFLLGGDFQYIADKFEIDNVLSYKSIHIAQDKIYSYAKTDDREGLESSYIYSYDKQGNIKKVVAKGELFKAAEMMKLSVKPLLGNNVKTINDKKESVNNFFANHKGVLVVSVYLDLNTGEIKSLSEKENNHYVTVFKQNDQFFLADTGKSNTGKNSNITTLTEEQVNNFIYNNPSIVNGITLN